MPGRQGRGGLNGLACPAEAPPLPHQCHGGCSRPHPLPRGGGYRETALEGPGALKRRGACEAIVSLRGPDPHRTGGAPCRQAIPSPHFAVQESHVTALGGLLLLVNIPNGQQDPAPWGPRCWAAPILARGDGLWGCLPSPKEAGDCKGPIPLPSHKWHLCLWVYPANETDKIAHPSDTPGCLACRAWHHAHCAHVSLGMCAVSHARLPLAGGPGTMSLYFDRFTKELKAPDGVSATTAASVSNSARSMAPLPASSMSSKVMPALRNLGPRRLSWGKGTCAGQSGGNQRWCGHAGLGEDRGSVMVWQEMRAAGPTAGERTVPCLACDSTPSYMGAQVRRWGGVGGGRASFEQGREGWRGFWTQNLVYQKWPDQIFPIVNLVFSHYGHFGLRRGGGGFGGGPPPWFLIILKKPWGGGARG